MKLTPKQQRFVAEYLVDLNATQAAIRAGYSPKTAGQVGFENLKKPEIQAAIQKAQQKRSERTEITQDYVLFGLQEVAERCMQRAPVVNGRGEQAVDEDGNAVWRFDGQTACRAFELLGKHLGIFPEKIKQENSGPDGGPIQTEIRLTLVRPPARDGSDG